MEHKIVLLQLSTDNGESYQQVICEEDAPIIAENARGTATLKFSQLKTYSMVRRLAAKQIISASIGS